jgi:transcriptional regulator with XRE-family HTH domain
MDYSKRIKELREKMGLTQIEFGKKLGYSNAYIADLERGEKKPSRNFLEKLNEIFGISADYILYGDQNQIDKTEKNIVSKGSLPFAFIERLKKDLKTQDEEFFNSLETPKEIIKGALKGKNILPRRSVIELAIKLNQPVDEYLILADYLPDEMKNLIKHKGLIGLFRKMSSLSSKDIDEVIETISRVLNPYLKK